MNTHGASVGSRYMMPRDRFLAVLCLCMEIQRDTRSLLAQRVDVLVIG